jgi:hypothetical protein
MSHPLASRIVSSLRLVLLACTLPAVAQDGTAPTQRIEVTATRYDVRTVCPTIEEDLPARLARMVHMIENRALVEVQFRIDGQRIVDVATRGGSFDTRSATRRAVRSLNCNSGDAGLQTVRFEVSYRLDDDTPASDASRAQAALVMQSGQARTAN